MADPETTMTNAWWAAQMASVAREASIWTAEICTDQSDLLQPARVRSVRRFISNIRDRLNWIEQNIGDQPDV